jgi:ABC-2 type transport system permease protein
MTLASEDKIAAAVIFREPLAIQIYTGSDGIKNRAIHSIMKAFSRQSGVMYALSFNSPQALASLDDPQEAGEELVRQKDLGVNRSMLDYYAVTMTIMILFMGGMTVATTFQDERKDRTLARMMASPKSRGMIYIQKVLGCMPSLLLQVLVVMLASTLLLGAHYAVSFVHNLLLFAMFFATPHFEFIMLPTLSTSRLSWMTFI